MHSYDLYLFDYDDTIIRTFETVSECHYAVLAARLGVQQAPIEKIRTYWGAELAESLRNIFGQDIDTDRAIDALSVIHRNNPIPPVEGVLRLLKILKKHGKTVGLISASPPSVLSSSIGNAFPKNHTYFDFVISSVELQIPKPSPHLVFLAMDKYRKINDADISLPQVVYIGDSIDDYQSARNSNVDFKAVLTGPARKEDFLLRGMLDEQVFLTAKEALVPPLSHGIVAVIQNEKKEFLLIQDSRKGNPFYGNWSGPHGRCIKDDVIEEETVVREVYEECGIEVVPHKRICTIEADSKVDAVSFWLTEPVSSSITFSPCEAEVEDIKWVSLEDILSGNMPLYPGSHYFFLEVWR